MSLITVPPITDETGQAIAAAISATNVSQARIAEINSAAEVKKQEVLDSIPADYTELSGDVDSLKEDLSELDSAIYKSGEEGKISFSSDLFVNGSISMSDGSVDTSAVSKVVMLEIMQADRDFNLEIASGYHLIYATYNEQGEKLTRTGSIANSIYIPAETYFRICIYPSSGEVITQRAPIRKYCYQVAFASAISDDLSRHGESIDKLFSIAENGVSIFGASEFMHGNIATDGTIDTSYTSRTVLTQIKQAESAITLNIENEYEIVYATYNAQGQKLTRTAQIKGTQEIPAGTYFRICICKTGSPLSFVAPIAEFAQKVTYPTAIGKRILELEKDSSVTSNRIAQNAVVTSKIANKAVTKEKTDFIIHNPNTSYINGWIEHAYINDGVETEYSGDFWATQPVYLEHDVQYYFSNLYAGYYAFYAADGTIIEYHNIDDAPPNPFTLPENAKYARFTAVTTDMKENAWIFTENRQPQPYSMTLTGVDTGFTENPCDFNGLDICAFNKCMCIGDSTTYGVFNHNEGETTQYTSDPDKAYPIKLQHMTGVECINVGLASATIDEWYDQKGDQIVSGYDMAIIQLGINDRFRYGEWTDTAKTALLNIISDLQEANSGIKIFVATIIPAIGFHGEIFDEISQGIRDTIEELDDDDVVLVDLALYGHTADNAGYDVGHLSEYGYTRLAMDYKSFISWHMHYNPVAYRQIQFIGTEYRYN